MKNNFIELFELFEKDIAKFQETVEDEMIKSKEKIIEKSDKERVEKIASVRKELLRMYDRQKSGLEYQKKNGLEKNYDQEAEKKYLKDIEFRIHICQGIQVFLDEDKIINLEDIKDFEKNVK